MSSDTAPLPQEARIPNCEQRLEATSYAFLGFVGLFAVIALVRALLSAPRPGTGDPWMTQP
jgi:hypothetical protein